MLRFCPTPTDPGFQGTDWATQGKGKVMTQQRIISRL